MSFENWNDDSLTPEQVQARILSEEEQLKHISEMRLRLREKIRDFMEEETGVAYKIEDDLSEIMKTFTQEQQQNVYGKIMLFQQFPNQDTNQQ
ncbi:MAG: hypothetical protein AB8E82_04315 [Aureispira sp.]